MIKKFGLYSILCIISGVLFFCYMEEIIIITIPHKQYSKATHTTRHKKIVLYYWQHKQWRQESQEMVWGARHEKNAHYLINALLRLLYEEKITHKKITVEAVLLSSSGHELYVSFDRNPLHGEASTYQKWLLIEMILKTVRLNEIKVQQIVFLHHHAPIEDEHLDFSKAWPLQGFLDR